MASGQEQMCIWEFLLMCRSPSHTSHASPIASYLITRPEYPEFNILLGALCMPVFHADDANKIKLPHRPLATKNVQHKLLDLSAWTSRPNRTIVGQSQTYSAPVPKKLQSMHFSKGLLILRPRERISYMIRISCSVALSSFTMLAFSRTLITPVTPYKLRYVRTFLHHIF